MRYNNIRRVGIYLDGNIYLRAYQYYQHHHKRQGRLDIGKFIEFISGRYDNAVSGETAMVEKHFIRKHTSAAECKANTANGLYNDRVFEDILLSEGITLRNIPVLGRDGHKSAKGVEMELAMAVTDSVVGQRIDTAILLISDYSYIPLIRQLKKYGVNTVLLSWEFTTRDESGNSFVTATSAYLKKESDIIYEIDRIIEAEYHTEEVRALFVDKPEETPAGAGRERAAILSLKESYGFLEYPGNNLYFHESELPAGLTIADLIPGDIMEFEKGTNKINNNIVAVKLTRADL